MPTTGLALKLQRVTAGLKNREMAAAMGVHPSRITHIEGSQVVTPAIAERYLTALAACAAERMMGPA